MLHVTFVFFLSSICVGTGKGGGGLLWYIIMTQVNKCVYLVYIANKKIWTSSLCLTFHLEFHMYLNASFLGKLLNLNFAHCIHITQFKWDQNFLKRFITIPTESEMLMCLARNILLGSIPL